MQDRNAFQALPVGGASCRCLPCPYLSPQAKPPGASGFRTAFIVAWVFCLLFYFMEYAVRSAPSVMLPELTRSFGLSTVGISSLLGLYYYSYAAFAIIAGASVDRWGAKYTIPVGVVLLALGTAMFGLGAARSQASDGSCKALVLLSHLSRPCTSRPMDFRRDISQLPSESHNASACSAARREAWLLRR